MAGGIVSTYNAQPGRGQELAGVLLEAAEYMKSVGGSSQVRNAWLAGEAAGQYQLITQFPTAAAQMEGHDRIIADVANNPLGGAIGQADSPATLGARFTITTAPEDAPMAEPAVVSNLFSCEISSGTRADALATFASAEEHHRELGAAARTLLITNAGPASGRVLYVLTFGSFVELGEFQAKRAASGAGPISAAIDAGTLSLAGHSTSILVSG